SKLPPQLRTRIAEATSGPEISPDYFVYRLEGPGLKVVGIACGALGVGLVVLLGVGRVAPFSHRYWGSTEVVLGGLGAFFAAWMVIANAIRIRALKRSGMKSAVVVSPILIAKTGLDGEPVEAFYLRELTHPNVTHHHTNGAYTHTAVRLRFLNGALNFDIRS